MAQPTITRSAEAGSARIDAVDVARGLALGGMLVVNLGSFSGAALVPLLRQSGADWAASLLVLLLAEGKFYPLFAFLFGWGIAHRQCLAQDGGGFFSNNLRRMTVLAAIGLLHAVLLWQGDILFVYALPGMLLPLLRKVPARVLAVLAVPLLLLAAFLDMPGPGAGLHAAYSDWINTTLSPWVGLHGSDPWANISPVRAHVMQFAWKLGFAPDWFGNYAALMLAGYACGRARVSKLPAAWAVILAALPLNLFYALTAANPYLLPPEWTWFLRGAALSVGGPLLGLGYALWAARVSQSPGGRVVFEPLRLIGRMPLTTYLGQSLIGALLFPWQGQNALAPWLIWPLAMGIFMVQLLFAWLWFKRFHQGPMEWLWRKLSIS